MFLACWSVKGGSGTTVVAAALSLVLARSAPEGVLLVDLDGDVPAALGLPEPEGPGVGDWLSASHPVEPEGLLRLAVPVGDGVGVVPRGAPDAWSAARLELLGQTLAGFRGPVVVDAGTLGTDAPRAHVVAAATTSLLVVRPCYLALRRAAAHPLHPDGVVLVHEPGRALSARDVEAVVGAPVRAEVTLDPLVARAVDAGLLAGRLPRSLLRPLRHAA